MMNGEMFFGGTVLKIGWFGYALELFVEGVDGLCEGVEDLLEEGIGELGVEFGGFELYLLDVWHFGCLGGGVGGDGFLDDVLDFLDEF
jgi:hypothetical protein